MIWIIKELEASYDWKTFLSIIKKLKIIDTAKDGKRLIEYQKELFLKIIHKKNKELVNEYDNLEWYYWILFFKY